MIVVIRNWPLVDRVGVPSMLITGVPRTSPSTFAVVPGCASVNGSGAKAATPNSARTGRAQRARVRERERRVTTRPI